MEQLEEEWFRHREEFSSEINRFWWKITTSVIILKTFMRGLLKLDINKKPRASRKEM